MIEKKEHTTQSSFTIPDFTLEATDGRVISPSMYRNKENLVLVFVQYYQCSSCYPLLTDLKKNYKQFREMNTEVLLIINCNENAVKNLQQLWMMPFPVLSDEDDHISKQFLGSNNQPRPALLIIDRFGSAWKYYNTGGDNKEIKLPEVMKWLEFIEIQCPECDVMDESTIDENLQNLPFIKI